MRISYIANVRMPTEKAHGGQIMKMCEAWGAEHQVTLWAPMRINYLQADPFEFYGVQKNFCIKKVFSLDLLPFGNILGKAAFWAQNLSFAALASVLVFFKKSDVIFSRDFWSAYFLSLFGKTVVYEIHDSPSCNFITRHVFKKVKKFITTNRYKADELINKFGVQKEQILIAHNGVDVGQFWAVGTKDFCRQHIGLPQNKKIILYSGHLYSWKGADVLLEAALKLGDEIVTVFVGGIQNDVMRLRSRAGFRENIMILGHQEYKKVPFYLGAADILVLPNTAKEQISLNETSPLKLFEYMAAGRPIVAADIPSIREIVSEKEVIFFRPDDANDLLEKISMILSDYDAYSKMSEEAKNTAAHYSWSGRASAILDFSLGGLNSNL